jgi:hypothetical protein
MITHLGGFSFWFLVKELVINILAGQSKAYTIFSEVWNNA